MELDTTYIRCECRTCGIAKSLFGRGSHDQQESEPIGDSRRDNYASVVVTFGINYYLLVAIIPASFVVPNQFFFSCNVVRLAHSIQNSSYFGQYPMVGYILHAELFRT